MKTLKLFLLAVGMSAAFMGSQAALAHHSAAPYESKAVMTLEGTVTRFQWVNPHSWIYMDVPNKQGQIQNWKIITNSLVTLQRKGWRPDSIKPGDKITVSFHPLKNGDPGGQFTKVVLSDGTVLTD